MLTDYAIVPILVTYNPVINMNTTIGRRKFVGKIGMVSVEDLIGSEKSQSAIVVNGSDSPYSYSGFGCSVVKQGDTSFSAYNGANPYIQHTTWVWMNNGNGVACTGHLTITLKHTVAGTPPTITTLTTENIDVSIPAYTKYFIDLTDHYHTSNLTLSEYSVEVSVRCGDDD